MLEVDVAEPGAMGIDALARAEAVVRSAFGADFRSHDWLHGVDGVHVVVTESGVLLAHASVVGRTLRHDGREYATGYVEAVAVHEDHRGRGLGCLVMDHAEAVIRDRFALGGLNAVRTAVPFYAGRGWTSWDGPTAADTPDGLVDTFDDDDRILLFGTPAGAGAGLSKDVPLICDWRVGDLW